MKLNKNIKNGILKALSRFNGIVEDCNIVDVINAIPLEVVVDKIDGWYENYVWSGEYVKDYYLGFNGYDDILVISFYTDPSREWKVRQVTPHFSIC